MGVHTALLALLLTLLAGQNRAAADAVHPQNCSVATSATCPAFIGYNASIVTNISRMATLFSVDYTQILGPNDLNLSISNLPGTLLPADRVYRIPATCGCVGGTRVVTSVNYTVQSGDYLSLIAGTYYAGLVTYQEIGTANSIVDDNKIYPNQSFTIPIECACAQSSPVLSYQIRTGDSVDSIASAYNVSSDAVLSLNANDNNLTAQSILFVPLPVCSAKFSKGSLDENLSVAEGTYELTANKCVQCYCNNGTLNCIPTPTSFNGGKCNESLTCKGSNITVGSFETSKNSSSSSCTVQTCIYEGYNGSGIISRLETKVEATCPAPSPPESVYNPPTNLTIPSPPPSLSPPASINTSAPAPSSSPSLRINTHYILSLLVLALCNFLV